MAPRSSGPSNMRSGLLISTNVYPQMSRKPIVRPARRPAAATRWAKTKPTTPPIVANDAPSRLRFAIEQQPVCLTVKRSQFFPSLGFGMLQKLLGPGPSFKIRHYTWLDEDDINSRRI